jgi:hypothetical protein
MGNISVYESSGSPNSFWLRTITKVEDSGGNTVTIVATNTHGIASDPVAVTIASDILIWAGIKLNPLGDK